MHAVLQYALLPFFFFPLAIASTWAGGHWPAAYVVFAMLAYILVDNFTDPLKGTPARPPVQANNAYLLLQIPLSFFLVGVLLLKLGLTARSEVAEAVVRGLRLQIDAFSSAGAALGASVAVGFHLSSSTVVAHEMMHRPSRFWQACSRVLLVLNGDGQFQEAHLYGHHANVGTANDPASARRYEWIYAFIARSTVGQWREAYHFEAHRLRKHGFLGRCLRHRVLRANLATAALTAGACAAFGWLAALGYVLVMATAKILLESINYVQHYGLVRKPGTKVEAKHSWDCESRGSSLYLFNLTRHSEHHASPRKPFWELDNPEEVPLLPHGYMLTILIALIPPLWFRYVDPLLDAREA